MCPCFNVAAGDGVKKMCHSLVLGMDNPSRSWQGAFRQIDSLGAIPLRHLGRALKRRSQPQAPVFSASLETLVFGLWFDAAAYLNEPWELPRTIPNWIMATWTNSGAPLTNLAATRLHRRHGVCSTQGFSTLTRDPQPRE
jgi:hypothetical protein